MSRNPRLKANHILVRGFDLHRSERNVPKARASEGEVVAISSRRRPGALRIKVGDRAQFKAFQMHDDLHALVHEADILRVLEAHQHKGMVADVHDNDPPF